LPDSLFSSIRIFEENNIPEDDMDKTLTSRLRRKSTVRIGHHNAHQKGNLTKSESLRNS